MQRVKVSALDTTESPARHSLNTFSTKFLDGTVTGEVQISKPVVTSELIQEPHNKNPRKDLNGVNVAKYKT